MEMKYKYRLVIYHSMPGFFRLDETEIEYSIYEGLVIRIVPRDSNKLIEATKYHIECGGFSSRKQAKSSGEKLRTHLKILNCMLDLGLSIPSVDGTSGGANDEIKNKTRKNGGELLDTIVGLHVFPDDGRHFEHVISGRGNVYPSDPYYVLKGIKDSWESSFELNDSALEVLEILNISVREKSPKIKFLTTYLAMEQLIKREMRSENAQKLIDGFVVLTQGSMLTDAEKKSLSGSLGYLKEQSFSSAFSSFAKRIESPKMINGMAVTKFVSECIKIRNKIAHNVATDCLPNIEEYTQQLRSMVMSILWTKNNFPIIPDYRPSDQIEMEKMKIRVL